MVVKERIVRILLIEEDKIDQIYVKEVLDQQHILYRLRTVTNVEEALHFLGAKKREEFGGDPDIILLDIDRREVDGLDFLSQIRSNAQWDAIKVFVLSDSNQERDRLIGIGASGYIVKPLKLRSPSRDTISFLIDLLNISQRR